MSGLDYEEDECFDCSDLRTTEYYYWNESINFNSSSGSEWEWPSRITITITSTLLGLVILLTIIGNVFVIAAVFVEKNLQNSVANYLIVSLALADLMVACLVMPLGALYEISGNKWILGPVLCDMWTSSDVLACTASILHLVAIAVDRYWAVTDIEYIRSRNKNRIFTMILLVWTVALLVSLAPFLGWKDPNFYSRLENEKRCQISQDIGYQIFATCATFYVPLFVILLLYWKIFQTARRRIRRRPGRLGIDKFKQVILADEGSSRLTVEGQTSNRNTPPPPPQSITATTPLDVSEPKKSETIESIISDDLKAKESPRISPNTSSSTSPNQPTPLDLNGGIEDRIPLATIPPLTTLTPSTSLYLSPPGTSVLSTPPSPTIRHRLSPPFTITSINNPTRKGRNKESIEAKRERKAAKTLAIITGAFVVCWLPFFVMALSLAICARCSIPVTVESSFLWLGYFNSTLNPIIYTLFSPEFRQAFKRILCGRERSRRRPILK